MSFWDDYGDWTKKAAVQKAMKAIVMQPDFAENNALTTDLRVPVTLLETNACSPLATNAIAGNIWDNFSSTAYKSLPSVGSVKIQDPFTYAVSDYPLPGGGRGFTRPPSLASLWSTGTYLLNNTIGPFNWRGTVDDRMDS